MRGTNKRTAFDLFMKGVQARSFPMTQSTWEDSDDWFRQAIAEDTAMSFDDARDAGVGFPRAWAWMAYGLALTAHEDWQPDSSLPEAVALADLAVQLDENDYDTHWVAAFVQLTNGNSTQAEFHRDEALYLVGEDRNLHLLNEMADVLVWLGKPDDAYMMLKKTRRTTDWNRWSMAWSQYFRARDEPSRYEEALIEAENTFWKPGNEHYEMDMQLLIAAIAIQQADFLDSINLPVEAQLKRDRAIAARDLFLTHKPNWTLVDEMVRMPFAETQEAQDTKNHWTGGLVKLGFQ